MKNIALAHAIPVFQPESINTPEGVAGLGAFQPDLLVVGAYGQILSKDVLSVPPQGGINVHASLLPKYRGAAPVAWAIYHGETVTGVTIIKMSVHLDAGEMLGQESLAIDPGETAGELEARLAPLGARLAMEVIGQIAAGTARGTKQDKSQVTKAPKLAKENGLINWQRTAPEVCNQIRAMQPWPTAYTYLHRPRQPAQRLIITKASCFETYPGDTIIAGAVVIEPADGTRLLVAAGNRTVVEIQELQPAGKRRMAAAEFMRGHRLQAGDFLGPPLAAG
jgi:methionyl-tRNA formyltransferase